MRDNKLKCFFGLVFFEGGNWAPATMKNDKRKKEKREKKKNVSKIMKFVLDIGRLWPIMTSSSLLSIYMQNKLSVCGQLSLMATLTHQQTSRNIRNKKYSQLDRLNRRLGTKLRCSDVTLLVTLQQTVSTLISLLSHAEGNRLHADFTY